MHTKIILVIDYYIFIIYLPYQLLFFDDVIDVNFTIKKSNYNHFYIV